MSKTGYNILYLCADSGIPYNGVKGGAIHMKEIVSGFAGNNCDVTVIARDAAGSSNTPQVTTYNLPDIKDSRIIEIFGELFDDEAITREFDNFHRNPDLESLLDEIHSKKDIDVVYERYSLFNVAGLRFSKKNNIPHILEVNAPLISEAQKYRKLAFSDTAAAVEKTLFGNADHIIAVSGELKEYIKAGYPDASITVIPNGVRFDHFASGTSNRTSKDDDGIFTVGFLGSLKPWHGVEILIDSFARLAKEDDESRLLIIGDNKKQDRGLVKRCRKKGIEDRVTFTGAVEYDNIPAWLHKADVLTAPYPMIENFYFSSLKVFEYMASGKAIVASNIGQISSILKHGRTGILVRPGDIDSLTDALRKLKEDADLRARLGERAQVEARLKHTWNHRVIDILKIIRKLTAETKRQ